MKAKRWTITFSFAIAGLIAANFTLSGCKPTATPNLTPTATLIPTSTPTPSPTDSPVETSPVETSMEDFAIEDFGAVHAPVGEDDNEYVIFGNIPISQPAADLSLDLAAFLGRWEGYSYAPPVKKDWKFVVVVQEITAQGGKAFLWAGTNLQYPTLVKEIEFRVVPGDMPAIECEYWDDAGQSTFTFTYDQDKDTLQGWQEIPAYDVSWGPIELGRDQSFHVYKDYAQYLAGKRIYPVEYQDEVFPLFYGPGYLLYLPEGYEDDPGQIWPLIIFLHGSGDRGDNLLLLAKASPFMMIREQGPLPFIIIAPLLKVSEHYWSFPESYMDGVLEKALADYRVDQKRIYVTGLSLGGEATYRFALHRPDMFAAVAPLAAYLSSPPSMESIKDLPVWAIHGADDTVVSLSAAQQPVDALEQAGGNVRFTVLEGHDHDVWTDTYSAPQFYDWLLQHQRP
jgi:predicted esterase